MPRPSKPGSFQVEVLNLLCRSDRPRTITTICREFDGWKKSRSTVNDALYALNMHKFIRRSVVGDVEVFQPTPAGRKYMEAQQ